MKNCPEFLRVRPRLRKAGVFAVVEVVGILMERGIDKLVLGVEISIVDNDFR